MAIIIASKCYSQKKNAQGEEKRMGKIFDDIFRTLCEKNSKLLIPLINEVFHKDYKMTEKIELWSGEHHVLSGDVDGLDERVTDSAIYIGHKLYHIECQSNPDGSMVLRMVEYDFHIAFLWSKCSSIQRRIFLESNCIF